uniref:Uncharacterized protein n=1 Tax=Gloeothece verrucosa (strain PCC 7822) TaxID=497965 RepID=E0UCY0_GLOV7|nr:hypothetical protein Cyan7822_4535 [Gloeothece verrucosa PCC 7822]
MAHLNNRLLTQLTNSGKKGALALNIQAKEYRENLIIEEVDWSKKNEN